MSSEDVIELGSSDDETEPAPKKIKPRPNAMVHIPNKLRGVTIKPVTVNSTSVPNVLTGKPFTGTKPMVEKPIFIAKASMVKPNVLSKVLGGKTNPTAKALASNAVTVTKLPNILANPYAIISKVNGKPVQNHDLSPPNCFVKSLKNKSVNNSLQIKNVVIQSKTNKNPSKVLVNPIRVHSPRSLNNLPPSITVTRTLAPKRAATASVSNTIKKKQKIVKNNVGDMLPLELDDDESLTCNSNPQWYMRPEEVKTMEAVNEEEPEVPKFIEITIEDSPIKMKPGQKKNTYTVGTELAITIDDSPIKNVANKNAHSSGSENDKGKENNKEPHSKKKLEYPNQVKVLANTVEIEIEPMEVLCTGNGTSVNDHIDNNSVEIQESPVKHVENLQTSTPKKNKATLPVSKPLDEKDEEIENKGEAGKPKEESSEEFHPIYQSFIDLCFKLENSDDMKKIVEKKIKAYYRQVPKSYTESEEFLDMVSSKVLSMKAGPEKMYLYIKDIVDELNMQRKIAKAQTTSKVTASSAESDNYLYGKDSEYDLKRQRQIRKLEKTLKKLHRAIQKLEEQEVDFDDEEDSVYLLTERYKERMVRVHAKFCQLTNTKMPSEPRVQLDARPGQPTGPAKRLEKWVNKKVPIGAPLPFPDFHDVIRCVKEANEEDKLGWNDADVMEEARDLFTRCGKKLQRRRQENEWRSAASIISLDIDPAEKSEDLKKQLDVNQQLASKKETEVFNKYADRQKQLKLEGEEIGDKEAEESPVESEDDESKMETSLEDKKKRKERLKRLLQEKAKKPGDEKENQPTKANENNETHTVAEMDVKKNPDISNIKDTEMKETNVDTGTLNINSNHTQNVTAINDNIKNCDEIEKSHSISDDSNRLESDIDELHLLQKLYSESEAITSTLESSDSDSPIAISDTLDSLSDSKNQTCDVISIENSSCSESETKNYDNNLRVDKIKVVPIHCKEIIDSNVEVECSISGIEKMRKKSNNDEYNESIEDILLASSDDDAVTKQLASLEGDCVNLKDDNLSIGETVIDAESLNRDSDNLKCYNKDDANSLDNSSVESLGLVQIDSSAHVKELDQSKNMIHISGIEKTNQSHEAIENQIDETVQPNLIPKEVTKDNSDKNINSVCEMIENNNTPKDDTIVEVIAGSSSDIKKACEDSAVSSL